MTATHSGKAAWRLDGFDGLRAAAAILVVAYHAASIVGATSAGALAPVAAELKAGVAIFFVISGALLYLPYARNLWAGDPAPSWRRYAWRRAGRILPGYWVALTILGLASVATAVLGSQWWRFYGLVQIYQPGSLERGLGVAWSLCVEVTFYLSLPAVAWALGRLVHRRPHLGPARVQLIALAGAAAWSLALRALLAHSLVAPILGSRLVAATSLPGLMDWFAAGMALAVVRAEWEVNPGAFARVRTLAQSSGRCWLLAGLAYAIGIPLQGGEYFLASYGVACHFFIALSAALFVLPAVVPRGERERVGPLKLLCSRPAIWLGTISYGLYLWHVPFRDVIDPWLETPRGVLAFAGMFALILGGGVCLGAASWYLVERPAQRWVSARLGRPGRRPVEVAAGGSVPVPAGDLKGL